MRALISSPNRKKKTATKTQQKSRLNIHNYPQSALAISLSQSNCCIAINLRVFFLKTEPRARTPTSSLTLTIAVCVCVWVQRGVVSNNRQALTNGREGGLQIVKIVTHTRTITQHHRHHSTRWQSPLKTGGTLLTSQHFFIFPA